MLGALVFAAVTLAQLPSQAIQAQQQREVAARGEEQRTALERQQREQIEREHAEERLLQRRAEEAAPVARQSAPTDETPRSIDAVISRGPSPSSPMAVRPRPDFSFPLMARSAAVGLLAGLGAFLLGRRFILAR